MTGGPALTVAPKNKTTTTTTTTTTTKINYNCVNVVKKQIAVQQEIKRLQIAFKCSYRTRGNNGIR